MRFIIVKMTTASVAPDKDAAAGSFGLAFIGYLQSVIGNVRKVVIEKRRAVIEMFDVSPISAFPSPVAVLGRVDEPQRVDCFFPTTKTSPLR
jgi:hypothetical protein